MVITLRPCSWGTERCRVSAGDCSIDVIDGGKLLAELLPGAVVTFEPELDKDGYPYWKRVHG